MRRAIVVCAVIGAACTAVSAAPAGDVVRALPARVPPPASVAFAPPEEYRDWYDEIAECAGVPAPVPFEALRFAYINPRSDRGVAWTIRGQVGEAEFTDAADVPTQITLPREQADDPSLVRHEMAHVYGGVMRGHSSPLFLRQCAARVLLNPMYWTQAGQDPPLFTDLTILVDDHATLPATIRVPAEVQGGVLATIQTPQRQRPAPDGVMVRLYDRDGTLVTRRHLTTQWAGSRVVAGIVSDILLLPGIYEMEIEAPEDRAAHLDAACYARLIVPERAPLLRYPGVQSRTVTMTVGSLCPDD